MNAPDIHRNDRLDAGIGKYAEIVFRNGKHVIGVLGYERGRYYLSHPRFYRGETGCNRYWFCKSYVKKLRVIT